MQHVSNAAPAASEGPSAEAWKAVKDVVHDLYIVKEWPLGRVRTHLQANYGLRTSERMLKDRLKKWDQRKNCTERDWLVLFFLLKLRRELGRARTEFSVHGKTKTAAEVDKHFKNRNMPEGDVVTPDPRNGSPPYIRAYTPVPGSTKSSSSRKAKQSVSPSSPRSISKCPLTPNASEPSPLPAFEANFGDATSFIPDTAQSSGTRSEEKAYSSNDTQKMDMASSEEFVWLSRSSSRSTRAVSGQCDRLQTAVGGMSAQLLNSHPLQSPNDFDNISSWEYMLSPPTSDDSPMVDVECSSCHEVGSAHFISIEQFHGPIAPPRNLLNEDEEAFSTLPAITVIPGSTWRWIALCFSACIALTQGHSDRSAQSLSWAASEFEQLLLSRDSLTLMAMNLLVTILHMHNQGEIAKKVVNNALQVAERVLPPEDPIRITVQWNAASADLSLDDCGIDSEVLRRVYETFKAEFGITHAHTLATWWNFGWMLLYEGSYAGGERQVRLYAEAERELEALYEVACSNLTPSHMASITARTSLSRAQFNREKYDAAIESMKAAICDVEPTLGSDHPFRLECKRRLAEYYEKNGQKELMEELYWDVLRGRIRMLGKDHPYTRGAKDDLIKLLKEQRHWEQDGSTQWKIDDLLDSTSQASSPHEAY